MGEIIDIKPLKDKILNEIKNLILKNNFNKKIAFLIFSDNFDAKIFLNELKNLFDELTLKYKELNLIDEKEEDIIKILDRLNNNCEINGILPIIPIPKNIDELSIYSTIKPEKDIDCLSLINLGKLFSFKPSFIPSVVNASFEILKYYILEKFNNPDYLSGKTAVIVGRSINTGRPLYILSLMNNMIPINLHSKVNNLEKFIKLGDIVFACCGVPELIKGYMIRENSIIIDIGINKSKNNEIVGDVDTKSVLEKVMAVTPVPNGVGEITKLMIVKNYLLTYSFI
ncbi:MAG TPA: bifunctional 5,10-methylenetetrahydrofolate dehydrogenase/5,10-methenyltetrahydrofolate cyclohydrolase [Caldisericia bacterium]|nr:bifunctional 5,10-methylenetetrahydrofolate dehydrogenase/5,10-methenyltetrahydrofolate cyclohydrolase [Caldisericia bacterium]